MGWERDCASSVRDLMKVVNKAGNIGVGVVATLLKAGEIRWCAPLARFTTATRKSD